MLRCDSENALDVAALGISGLDRVLTTGQGDGSIVEQIDDDAGPFSAYATRAGEPLGSLPVSPASMFRTSHSEHKRY